MAEEKREHNENCNADGHDEHLCFLMYDGFHYREKAAFKALVDRAEYRCQNCGRTANRGSSLCEPMDL
jgi:hypothetical protein